MQDNKSVLFTPFHSAKLDLANRLVMAPMTRSAANNGVPGEDVAHYYRRRAENDIGLIITEATTVNDPATLFSNEIPQFYGAGLDGWRKVAEAVHSAGGKIAPQLWHLGMVRNPRGPVPNPDVPSVGPSGLTKDGRAIGEPMTQKQIDLVVNAFAQGAADAQALGFDAVEIHGAHGYLIDQFLWSQTNRRNDAYGGDLVKRTRFAVDIVEAARARVGPDFPIIFRFSQWKEQFYDARLATTPAELEQLLAPLVDAGVDLFHASTRRFWEPEFSGSKLNLAGWTQKITGKPTISVGSVGLQSAFRGMSREVAERREIDDLVERMAQGEFDLIAVGRALLADPQWGRKIREGREHELSDFTPDVYNSLY